MFTNASARFLGLYNSSWFSLIAFHWAEEHHSYQITIKEIIPFTPAFVGIVGPKIAESKNCILYTFSVNMAFHEVIYEQTN